MALAGTHAFVSCWGNFWAQKSSCACARLTRAKTRATRDCVVLQRSRHGEAAAGGSTGGDVPAPGMAHVPRHLAQKVKGVTGLLTEARNGAVLTCRAGDVGIRRRRRGGVRGWVVAEAGVECSEPGEAPEVEAEPMRSLDGAPVRRSGGIPAAQGICSGAEGVAALGFGGYGSEEEGRLGLLFVGRRAALACGSGAGARRGSRPEITAGRYARAEGAGGGRRSWQAGPGCSERRGAMRGR